MKLLITFVMIGIMVLCYWVFSDDSYYWRVTKERNGKLEQCLMAMSFFVIILAMVFMWLN